MLFIMNSIANPYASYLVRLWQGNAEGESESSEYRVEVEHIQSGERRAFADPQDFWNYLNSVLLTPPGANGSDATDPATRPFSR